jgi:hypothetical protein
VTHGTGINTETNGGIENIGFWDNPDDWASWTTSIKAKGAFDVTAVVATQDSPTAIDFEIAGHHLSGEVPLTGGWQKYQEIHLGQVTLSKTGTYIATVKPANHSTWKPMNLRAIHLKKIP